MLLVSREYCNFWTCAAGHSSARGQFKVLSTSSWKNFALYRSQDLFILWLWLVKWSRDEDVNATRLNPTRSERRTNPRVNRWKIIPRVPIHRQIIFATNDVQTSVERNVFFSCLLSFFFSHESRREKFRGGHKVAESRPSAKSYHFLHPSGRELTLAVDNEQSVGEQRVIRRLGFSGLRNALFSSRRRFCEKKKKRETITGIFPWVSFPLLLSRTWTFVNNCK